MRKPDFFIVGAPKCGTTAMHAWLNRHPQLHMLRKELHYWGSDLNYLHPRYPKVKYEKHLKAAPPNAVLGEVAVWYLQSEKAAAEIKAYHPEARIVIMLRDPVEAVHSLHSQMVYTGNEPLHHLKEALDAEPGRRKGKGLPAHYYCPAQGLCYTDVYRYAGQVQRYLDRFEPHRIHFICFDDLKNDPARVYRNLLVFLGVDPSFTTGFNTINAHKETRSRNIQKVMLTPGKGLKKAVKTLIPFKFIREKIKGKVWEANTQKTQRKPLSKENSDYLKSVFEPEIKALTTLTGKTFFRWD